MLYELLESYYDAEKLNDTKKMNQIIAGLFQLGMDASSFRTIYSTWKQERNLS